MSEHAHAVGVALAYMAALGGNDPAAVTDLVHEDFVNEHHAELGSGCVGRDEYARRLPGFFGAFGHRRYTVTETSVGVRVVDPTNVDLTTVDLTDVGTTEGDVEVVVRYRFGADVERTRIDIPGVMWITVRGDLVSRRLDCWDSLTFHRQTGTVTTS